MRASSDSWRGSIDRRGSTEGGGGSSNPTTTTNKKHQCLFAACVPAKECDPEEVKCVFFFSNFVLFLFLFFFSLYFYIALDSLSLFRARGRVRTGGRSRRVGLRADRASIVGV